MKTPTINSRILKLEVLKDTATRTSVNAVESRTTSLESDVATAQSDISTLQTDVSAAEGNISTLQGDVATLTQGIQDAVSTHNTAHDSHADLRTLIGDRALSVHQHARADLPWVTEPGAALLTAASASAQRTALGMTAWAVAPWTDGTTSDIPEGTQLYFTNARADARIAAQKGQADGLAPLDAGGKVPSANLPDSIAQADDAARLGGQLPSYYAQASHVHNYAGSSTPGGAATTALACTGNAATATTAASCTGNSATATTASSCSGNAATATALATPRTLTIGSKANTFDGSADKAWTLAEIGAIDGERILFTPTLTFDAPPAGWSITNLSCVSVRSGSLVTSTICFRVVSAGTGGDGYLRIIGMIPFPRALQVDRAYSSTCVVNYVNLFAAGIHGADILTVLRMWQQFSAGDLIQISINYET